MKVFFFQDFSPFLAVVDQWVELAGHLTVKGSMFRILPHTVHMCKSAVGQDTPTLFPGALWCVSGGTLWETINGLQVWS